MFRTKYSERAPIFSDPGSPIAPEYALIINDEGVQELVQVGEINTFDQIQSHADSVDIHNILARYANGDETVLNKAVSMYFDASELPDNMADMYRTVANGEHLFNKLPVDIRAQFNHSFTEFVASIGTDHFNNVFNPPAVSSGNESEVNTNES